MLATRRPRVMSMSLMLMMKNLHPPLYPPRPRKNPMLMPPPAFYIWERGFLFSCSTSSFISFIVLLKLISFINYNNGCAVRAAPVIKYWLLLRQSFSQPLYTAVRATCSSTTSTTIVRTRCTQQPDERSRQLLREISTIPSIMLAAANEAKAINFVTAVYE